MTLELLYLPDCPNHGAVADAVRSVLAAEGVSAKLTETPIFNYEEALAHGFRGSPSLRVNGLDIESTPAEQFEVGFACRAYWVDGKPQGLPPRSWIEDAIRVARNQEEQS